MSESERDETPVAEVIDSVLWDYDPDAEEISPLISAERYFRDFPWDPEEEQGR